MTSLKDFLDDVPSNSGSRTRILSFLSPKKKLAASRINQNWWCAASQPALWKRHFTADHSSVLNKVESSDSSETFTFDYPACYFELLRVCTRPHGNKILWNLLKEESVAVTVAGLVSGVGDSGADDEDFGEGCEASSAIVEQCRASLGCRMIPPMVDGDDTGQPLLSSSSIVCDGELFGRNYLSYALIYLNVVFRTEEYVRFCSEIPASYANFRSFGVNYVPNGWAYMINVLRFYLSNTSPVPKKNTRGGADCAQQQVYEKTSSIVCRQCGHSIYLPIMKGHGNTIWMLSLYQHFSTSVLWKTSSRMGTYVDEWSEDDENDSNTVNEGGGDAAVTDQGAAETTSITSQSLPVRHAIYHRAMLIPAIYIIKEMALSVKTILEHGDEEIDGNSCSAFRANEPDQHYIMQYIVETFKTIVNITIQMLHKYVTHAIWNRSLSSSSPDRNHVHRPTHPFNPIGILGVFPHITENEDIPVSWRDMMKIWIRERLQQEGEHQLLPDYESCVKAYLEHAEIRYHFLKATEKYKLSDAYKKLWDENASSVNSEDEED